MFKTSYFNYCSKIMLCLLDLLYEIRVMQSKDVNKYTKIALFAISYENLHSSTYL